VLHLLVMSDCPVRCHVAVAVDRVLDFHRSVLTQVICQSRNQNFARKQADENTEIRGLTPLPAPPQFLLKKVENLLAAIVSVR